VPQQHVCTFKTEGPDGFYLAVRECFSYWKVQVWLVSSFQH